MDIGMHIGIKKATAPTEDLGARLKAGDTLLDLVHVCRSFDGVKIIKDVNLKIKKNEFFTLVGPSGSGKTTILKMLAGMDQPTSGDIVLNGQSISTLPPDKRPTCMVFQFLALFPHMTVGQNIEFPMRIRGVPRAERVYRAQELMDMVSLPEKYYDKNVMKCSGGERQRVAIARAFAYDPEILLFDEPLSAIDARLRKTLQKELKELHHRSGKTFIYITHSLEEAMYMSDRVGVLKAGELTQVGTPEEIYRHPNCRFVAEFIGDTNIFPIKLRPQGGYRSEELPDKLLKVSTSTPDYEGYLIVRPESLHVVEDENGADNVITCKVGDAFSLGSRSQFQLMCGRKSITLELPHAQAESLHGLKEVKLGWNAEDAVFVTK